jgi:hypothetical protein
MRKRPELRKVIKVLKKFQELDIEMQIPTMIVFLEVAMWDDAEAPSVIELGKKTGLKTAATSGSRNVMAFCELNRGKKLGFDMMETKENPEYRIEKLVYMKPRGNSLADDLVNTLQKSI